MMFSVVMCTYNRSGLVGRSIGSVLAQSFEDFELIVVNDGSSDDTAAVLDAYDDPRLRPVHRENGGLSAARNSGIREATGRFVTFLDDDDEANVQWLEKLAAAVDETTGIVNCGSTLTGVDRKRFNPQPVRSHDVFPDVRGSFVAGTFALAKEIIDEIGGYAENIPTNHQTELLLRALPALKRRGMTSSLVDESLILIEMRVAEERPRNKPAVALAGSEYLINHHGSLLAARPETLADHHAVAGTAAARLDDLRLARSHFRKAARIDPRNVKNAGRLVVAMVPPLARRTWASI